MHETISKIDNIQSCTLPEGSLRRDHSRSYVYALKNEYKFPITECVTIRYHCSSTLMQRGLPGMADFGCVSAGCHIE